MDIMKSSSEYRVMYHDTLHGSKFADRTMKDVYSRVQKYYNQRYEKSERFPVCFSRQPSYYEQLLIVCCNTKDSNDDYKFDNQTNNDKHIDTTHRSLTQSS